jgi:hypothetical protein
MSMSRKRRKGRPPGTARDVLRLELADWVSGEPDPARPPPEPYLHETVCDLLANQTPDRSLEDYLKALWKGGREYRERPFLTFQELVALLTAAFTAPVPPFDDAWRSQYDGGPAPVAGFAIWEAMLLWQVVDLREAEEQGWRCEDWDDLRSPHGTRWANNDLHTFLERGAAATAGSLWRRRRGASVQGDNREVTWESFAAFLQNGQHYE